MRLFIASLALFALIFVQSHHFLKAPAQDAFVIDEITVSFSTADIIAADLDALSCCAGFDAGAEGDAVPCNIDCSLVHVGQLMAVSSNPVPQTRTDSVFRFDGFYQNNFRPPIV